MSGPMSGPGLGLQLPQNLYPSELQNAPYDLPANRQALAPGQELPIPRGDWILSLGMYCILEYLDPVTGVWTYGASASGNAGGDIVVSSDGFNVRAANRTGCPVGGIVNTYGSGYVQASTTISVTGGGGSTWVPIVGGQLTMATSTIVTANAGAGYGVAPLVFIPAPPPASTNPNGIGGVQASGYCTIASGTVSGFTFTNPGAGYPSIPTPVIYPNPTDPNINTGITQATITFSLTGSGSITGVLCTNPGAPLSTPNNITLTVSGAGTNATVSAIMMQTITAASLTGGSTIAGASVSALVTTVNGYPLSAGPATPTSGTITNGPTYLLLGARPRPAQIALTVGAAGTLAAQTGTLYDSGLFYSVPTPIVMGLTNLAAAVVGTIVGSSTIALTMGSKADIITLQPLRP